MDGITLYCILKELSGYLPLRVQKIQQPVTPVLSFSVWSPEIRAKLVLSLEGGLPFFGFSDERRENPKVPSGFCLGLRKRLEGGPLTAVRQEGLDRVVYLDFWGHDDFGNTALFTLVFDMAGKGANIGLYKDDRLIAAAMPPDGSRFDNDGPYTPPEKDRLDIISSFEREELDRALREEKGPALRALTRTVQGLGRDLALSVLARAKAQADSPLSDDAREAVVACLKDLSDSVVQGRYFPAIYETAKGDVFFHALPLFHLQPVRTFETVLEAAQASRSLSLGRHEEEALRSYASSLYRKVQKKLEARLSAQWEDLMAAEDAGKYRLWGELLNSSGLSVGPGLDQVEVLDYYKDPPAPTVIPLDPRYSSRDNARNYFAKYAKMVRAAKVLRESTGKLRAQLERLKAAEKMTSLDEVYRAIGIIEKAAAEAGIKVRGVRGKRSGTSRLTGSEFAGSDYGSGGRPASGSEPVEGAGARLPAGIQQLSGPGGSVIYVGGNAKANDYLVSKLRRPGDVWLHAKGTKGAHVLLRPPEGSEPSDEMLLAAARLAAEKSQASGATKVEVDLVDAMRVKKPRGGAPGFVTYTGQKTVVVSLA